MISILFLRAVCVGRDDWLGLVLPGLEADGLDESAAQVAPGGRLGQPGDAAPGVGAPVRGEQPGQTEDVGKRRLCKEMQRMPYWETLAVAQSRCLVAFCAESRQKIWEVCWLCYSKCEQ